VEGDLLLTLVRPVLRVDVAVAGAACDIARRIVDLLERVHEVLVGDRELLAAPVPVRVRLDRVRERRLGRARAGHEILEPDTLVVLVERAVQGLTGCEERARELVAAREHGVEAVDVLFLAEDEDVLGLAALGRARHLRPRLRERRCRRLGALCRAGHLGRRGRRRCNDHHRSGRARNKPEAFVHRFPPLNRFARRCVDAHCL
jgi:hypothetical protein